MVRSNDQPKYQLTIKVPIDLQAVMLKRLKHLGFASYAEYVRHLIINDVNGMEEYYGQMKDPV